MSVMFGIGPCRTPLGFVSSYAAVPGCAPRPWAMEFYPYGVNSSISWAKQTHLQPRDEQPQMCEAIWEGYHSMDMPAQGNFGVNGDGKMIS